MSYWILLCLDQVTSCKYLLISCSLRTTFTFAGQKYFSFVYIGTIPDFSPSRGGRMFPLSVPAGSVERCLQRPFSGSFCCPSLWAWKCVQPPRHSVSAAVSHGPRLKNAKGAAEKSGPAYLSGLMSKMLQSSGNLLQSGTRSLLLQRGLQRNEREEK